MYQYVVNTFIDIYVNMVYMYAFVHFYVYMCRGTHVCRRMSTLLETCM